MCEHELVSPSNKSEFEVGPSNSVGLIVAENVAAAMFASLIREIEDERDKQVHSSVDRGR